MTVLVIIVIYRSEHMSPKSLSAEEKTLQREKLLIKGGELLAAYGMRKTSVEDITNAARMAKGTFYQHFDSKEHFFFELLVQYHKDWFKRAEEFLSRPDRSDMPLSRRVRDLIKMIFQSTFFLPLFKYHDELEELIRNMQALSSSNVSDLAQMEIETYEKLLKLCGIDTQKVRAEVISIYIHTMYFGLANAGQTDRESADEAFEAMLNGLILYIFGDMR